MTGSLWSTDRNSYGSCPLSVGKIFNESLDHKWASVVMTLLIKYIWLYYCQWVFTMVTLKYSSIIMITTKCNTHYYSVPVAVLEVRQQQKYIIINCAYSFMFQAMKIKKIHKWKSNIFNFSVCCRERISPLGYRLYVSGIQPDKLHSGLPDNAGWAL